jgi:hypothetical protein
MVTRKQTQAAKRNIKKAQARWKALGVSHREHATSQPEGRGRQKPGTTGKGNYYHVEVRPKAEFNTFRTQDVGEHSHLQRVAGKRSSGSWSTAKWLISKEDAHVEDGKLVPDTKDAKDLLKKLGSTPIHLSGDRFKAKDRPNVPEHAKPTPAQTRARRENIRQAQAARRRKS